MKRTLILLVFLATTGRAELSFSKDQTAVSFDLLGPLKEMRRNIVLTEDDTPWELMHALLVCPAHETVYTRNGKVPLLKYLFSAARHNSTPFIDAIIAAYEDRGSAARFPPFVMEDHADQFLAVIASADITTATMKEQQVWNRYLELCRLSVDYFDTGWDSTDGAWTLIHFVKNKALLEDEFGVDVGQRIEILLERLSGSRDVGARTCFGTHDNFAMAYYLQSRYGTGCLTEVETVVRRGCVEQKVFETLQERKERAIREISRLEFSEGNAPSSVEDLLRDLHYWGHTLEWISLASGGTDEDMAQKEKLERYVLHLLRYYQGDFGRRGVYFHALHGLLLSIKQR